MYKVALIIEIEFCRQIQQGINFLFIHIIDNRMHFDILTKLLSTAAKVSVKKKIYISAQKTVQIWQRV